MSEDDTFHWHNFAQSGTEKRELERKVNMCRVVCEKASAAGWRVKFCVFFGMFFCTWRKPDGQLVECVPAISKSESLIRGCQTVEAQILNA